MALGLVLGLVGNGINATAASIYHTRLVAWQVAGREDGLPTERARERKRMKINDGEAMALFPQFCALFLPPCLVADVGE